MIIIGYEFIKTLEEIADVSDAVYKKAKERLSNWNEYLMRGAKITEKQKTSMRKVLQAPLQKQSCVAGHCGTHNGESNACR